MSFEAVERSNQDGKPVKLFVFQAGGQTWRYANAPRDVVVRTVRYFACAISHRGFSSTGNPDSDELTIAIDARAPVCELFLGTPPSGSVSLRIRSYHIGESDAPIIWSGLVKGMVQVSDAESELRCNSLLSTLKRPGLRLSWGRGCPHALYDAACKVNPTAYATSVQVASRTGNSITASALAALDPNGDGYLSGGFLSFVAANGATYRRGIESQDGDTITLLENSDGISNGMWINVYPGCNRTSGHCLDKFSNLGNYGGFPHLPQKSPFDGDPVF